jgi:gamma-glutamylcyclotransferase (GGCT)/AIG2-like uncharacterized protein YtfP
MNTLFVYGIFLDQHNRDAYGMHNPRYATVPGYITMTRHGSIVEAVNIELSTIALTGLLVDVNPKRWDDIDSLEWGYDRIEVTTTNGQRAWMYAAKEKR